MKLRFLGDKLNQSCNYLLDWNRFGGLFFSNHSYTEKEFQQRIKILNTSFLFGLCSYLNSNSMQSALFFTAIGFLISHYEETKSLIHKRIQFTQDLQIAENKIHSCLQKNFSTHDHHFFTTLISTIKNSKLGTNSSSILGKRKRLMENLLDILEKNEDAHELLLSSEQESIDFLNSYEVESITSDNFSSL